MNKNVKIYITGSTGMVGSACLRILKSNGYSNIITSNSKKLDLRNQSKVFDFFTSTKVEYAFLAAAKVGGILENSTKKAEFIYDNLTIQSNVIHASYENKVKKLFSFNYVH